jgi:hypothetical protein
VVTPINKENGLIKQIKVVCLKIKIKKEEKNGRIDLRTRTFGSGSM